MSWFILTWNPLVWPEPDDAGWDAYALTGQPDQSPFTWGAASSPSARPPAGSTRTPPARPVGYEVPMIDPSPPPAPVTAAPPAPAPAAAAEARLPPEQAAASGRAGWRGCPFGSS